MKLVEKCNCGAKFSVTDAPLDDARKLWREWRKFHDCPDIPDDKPKEEYAGSTAGAVIERDTIGFQRTNNIEYYEEEL